MKRRGKHRLIDKVDVRLLASEDTFWASLANFGDKFVHIPDEIVYRYERLLGGGVWSQLDLIYDPESDSPQKRPFYIKALKPIQVAAFEMTTYVEGRKRFSRDEWLDLVVRAIGLEATHYDMRGKLLAVLRLVPMAEHNYNLIELGPWGTGKSFVYRETSPNAILVSGGKVTVPQLFVHLGTGRVGLLGLWDVVAFDEVAGLEVSEPAVVNMLKDYLESGSFVRGREEIPAEASVVFVGNTSKAHEELVRAGHLFSDLPKRMIDPAFLDRLHYFLPGWEAPKLERRLFTNHFGFVSDYFSEALRQLRKTSYVYAVHDDFALGSHLNARDERAVRKTVSGPLKLLHPHGEWNRAELRQYLEFALEGRRRVKEQLKKLAPHDYSKTAFSYIERDTRREFWVGVPEQPEDLDPLLSEVAASDVPSFGPPSGIALGSATADLIAAGESSRVEFKSTARVNLHTSQRDTAMEVEVAKTIAGFMNAQGGTLLIGVDDAGHVLGLGPDIASLPRRDVDALENVLTSILENTIGKPAIANLAVTFDDVPGGQVCRIDVTPGKAPAYVRTGKSEADLYVRLNNSTRLLNTADAIEYVRARWGR